MNEPSAALALATDDTASTAVTLSSGGESWPTSSSGWRQRWRALSRVRPTFLDSPHPAKPEAVAESRQELWIRTLGQDRAAMQALAEEGRDTWLDGPLVFMIPMLLGLLLSVLSVGITLDMIGRGDFLQAAMPATVLMAIVSIQFLGIGALRRRMVRREYLADIERRLGGPGAPERLAATIRQAGKQGLALSGELLAWADAAERGGCDATSLIALEDCLSLAELQASMRSALPTMRAGAVLALKGENSELLHRSAASMGEHDLDALAEEIRNPRGKTL